jgi:hypothetical protein
VGLEIIFISRYSILAHIQEINMGDVIRKDSAVVDIITDVKESYTKAKAKGELFGQIAEEKLGSTVELIHFTEGRLRKAREEFAPLHAALDVMDDQSDLLLKKTADDVWNSIGRPASDPAYEIIFPGGVSYYAEGSDEDQPNRMELLAELLESGVHPRLDKELAQNAANAIRAKAAEYRGLLDQLRMPKARVTLLEKVWTAISRSAQAELVKLKRRYKSEGFSETEIHSIIPDRPRAAGFPSVASVPLSTEK